MHFPLSSADCPPSPAAWVFIATHPQLWWHARVKTGRQTQAETVWEDLWNAMLERLQRPVTGVLLNRDAARRIGEPLLLRLVRMHGDEAAGAETGATVLGEAAEASKCHVAEERKLSHDQERHRDP